MDTFFVASVEYKPVIICATLTFMSHDKFIELYKYAARNGLSGMESDGATVTFFIDPEREIEVKDDGSIHGWRKKI